MTLTIPLILVYVFAASICYRYVGLRIWHLLVFLVLAFLLTATSAGPAIHNWLISVLNGGRQ